MSAVEVEAAVRPKSLLYFPIDGCSSMNTTLPASSNALELNFNFNWPETMLGEVAELKCPCEVDVGRVATRMCGGDFETGAVWEEVVDSRCDYSDTTRMLCLTTEVSIPATVSPETSSAFCSLM